MSLTSDPVNPFAGIRLLTAQQIHGRAEQEQRATAASRWCNEKGVTNVLVYNYILDNEIQTIEEFWQKCDDVRLLSPVLEHAGISRNIDRALRRFVCDCVELALKREEEKGVEVDKRLWEHLRTYRRYANGKVAKKEFFKAQRSAASIASWATEKARSCRVRCDTCKGGFNAVGQRAPKNLAPESCVRVRCNYERSGSVSRVYNYTGTCPRCSKEIILSLEEGRRLFGREAGWHAGLVSSAGLASSTVAVFYTTGSDPQYADLLRKRVTPVF